MSASGSTLIRSLDFYTRYFLILVWMLFVSIVGILAIPFLFGKSWYNRWIGRFGGWGLQRITRVRVRILGERSLESYQPCIYIANHQDNFDMVIFGTTFPDNAIVIGKREIAYIPFFNLFYYAAGNIFIDRKHRTKAIAGIEAVCRKIVERGVSVMIFPEGTRNRTGKGLLPFKKGAFHMAIETGLPLVPLVASPVGRVLDYAEKRITPGEIQVRILDPISTKGLGRADIERLANEAREKMLAAYQAM